MKYFLYDFAGYNKIIFEKINNFLGQEESYLLSLADQIGFYRSLPVILPLLIIYCYFSISATKQDHLKYIKTVHLWIKTFASLFISLFCILAIIALMKMCFAYARPFCTEGMESIKVLGAAATHAQCDRSFPSGHTAYSSIILFSLWPIFNKTTKILGTIMVVSIALSRIASGVHFPADIFWSALISIILVATINCLLNKAAPLISPYITNLITRASDKSSLDLY